mmetsp:Transcript_56592/g.168399  ORF Transcript_56592/g.168399 Transcript_56592/m.168399 type:complete len:220 (-) Transcript_56592:2009-2668(-)
MPISPNFSCTLLTSFSFQSGRTCCNTSDNRSSTCPSSPWPPEGVFELLRRSSLLCSWFGRLFFAEGRVNSSSRLCCFSSASFSALSSVSCISMSALKRPFSRVRPEVDLGITSSCCTGAAASGFEAAFFLRTLGSFGQLLTCSTTIVARSTPSSSPICSKSSLAPSAHFLACSPSCRFRWACATPKRALASRCVIFSLTPNCRASSAKGCASSPSSMST